MFMIENLFSRANNRAVMGILNRGLLFAALMIFCLPCFAQQPYLDGNGEGTLFVNRGGITQVNIADGTISFGYLYDNNHSDLTFGANVSGKLAGDRVNIFGNNRLAPNTKLTFSVGKKFLAKKVDYCELPVTAEMFADVTAVAQQKKLQLGALQNSLATGGASSSKLATLEDLTEGAALCSALNKIKNDSDVENLKEYVNSDYDRLVFQGGYGYTQYNLFAPTLPIDQQLYKRNFHNPFAQVIYSQFIGANILVGGSAGIKRSNNAGDLTEIEVRDFTTMTSGPTIREVGRTRKALRGDFREFTSAFVNTDFAWFPRAVKRQVGINLFTRSSLAGEEKGFRPGVGLFFSKEGEPTKVIGGVSVSLDNNQKINVSLVAGFNF
jgi:hypothetical protein